MPKRKKKSLVNDHEKKFLMDGERKLTIRKAATGLLNKLNQKSTVNNQHELGESIDLIQVANDVSKSELKEIRRRLTRR